MVPPARRLPVLDRPLRWCPRLRDRLIQCGRRLNTPATNHPATTLHWPTMNGTIQCGTRGRNVRLVKKGRSQTENAKDNSLAKRRVHVQSRMEKNGSGVFRGAH